MSFGSISGGSGGGGDFDGVHNSLTGKSASGQHPSSSITTTGFTTNLDGATTAAEAFALVDAFPLGGDSGSFQQQMTTMIELEGGTYDEATLLATPLPLPEGGIYYFFDGTESGAGIYLGTWTGVGSPTPPVLADEQPRSNTFYVSDKRLYFPTFQIITGWTLYFTSTDHFGNPKPLPAIGGLAYVGLDSTDAYTALPNSFVFMTDDGGNDVPSQVLLPTPTVVPVATDFFLITLVNDSASEVLLDGDGLDLGVIPAHTTFNLMANGGAAYVLIGSTSTGAPSAVPSGVVDHVGAPSVVEVLTNSVATVSTAGSTDHAFTITFDAILSTPAGGHEDLFEVEFDRPFRYPPSIAFSCLDADNNAAAELYGTSQIVLAYTFDLNSNCSGFIVRSGATAIDTEIYTWNFTVVGRPGIALG